MLCGHLMYIKARLVISSTERQHAIISDVHKGLGHDSRPLKQWLCTMEKDSTIQKIQIFLARDRRRCRRID